MMVLEPVSLFSRITEFGQIWPDEIINIDLKNSIFNQNSWVLITLILIKGCIEKRPFDFYRTIKYIICQFSQKIYIKMKNKMKEM